MTKKLFSPAMILIALVLFSTSACYHAMGKYLELPKAEHKVTVEKNVMVTMRDGVRLATDVYKPADATGPLPVILTRLPYNKDNIGLVGKLLAQRGYVYVVQDCRATFHSEGEVFVPLVYEREDGRDTVDWIAKQNWFNGSLAGWGPSYLGITQWAIADDNPYLKCFYPQITTGRMDQAIFLGGAFSYRLSSGWSASVGKQSGKSLPVSGNKVDMKTEGFFNLPLAPEIPLAWEQLPGLSLSELTKKLASALGLPAGETPPDTVSRMIALMNYPAFAENVDAFNFMDRYTKVTAPALMVAGWYDIFIQGQLSDFMAMKKMSPGDAGRYTRIVIGPWGHVSGVKPDAGKDARLGTLIKDFFVMKWYDRWMKGDQNGVEKEAPIKIYVMGKNIWRDEREWPLARAQSTKFFLHGRRPANSVNGNGAFSTEPPGDEPPDKYAYDPKNPVLTAGGNNLLEDVGAKDQAAVEQREDVLIFTSAPMTSDLEITGPITAVIYAASSAVDTDFTVKLCDVYPDGKSWNLTEGIIRARYRESSTLPSLIEPGKIYEYHVLLWPTSNCFLKGHRLRVQIASSSFPRFDRNSNTGGQGGPLNSVIANQTIYHDNNHPSHLVLPVIP